MKDILSVEDGIICHQVNCMKVMGAGLALEIKNKWPKVYREYMTKSWRLGDCQLIEVNSNLFIANLAGQLEVGKGVQTNYVSLGNALSKLNNFAMTRKLQVYIPHGIGCGLAGGDWNVVSKIIKQEVPNAIICKNG